MHRHSRVRRRTTWLVLGAALAAAGCAGVDAEPAGPPPVEVRLDVRDEAGVAVPGAIFTAVDGLAARTATPIELVGPVAGVVTSPGHLPEPVVLSPDQPVASVRLWSTVSDDGTPRRALHFGGDVMLGRRYQAPTPGTGTATAFDAAEAADVVSSIAPIMAAADATFVNLETVVGDLHADAAFDGKRFLLQTPSAALAALQEMGVDLVALGNNHANDWKDAGVRSTLDALDAAGIGHAGAGLDARTAAAARSVEAGGIEVATVSMTTVNGDFVNDQLPTVDDEEPVDLPDSERWQYEARVIGFGSPGDAAYLPRVARRVGDAWRAFEAIERAPDADPDAVAALWAALTSPDAYPELQDWVARRGHGGAAAFDREVLAGSIAAARADGADVVVVQLHAGFQFSEVASEMLRRAARDAVDAGADLVVAHHPHVLQGFEWYRGHLIAHSLGNLVFDQDFLATFPSVVLRTVWEGDRLVDARVVPLTIDRYRPVPVGGRAALDVIRMLDARSALAGVSARVGPLDVGTLVDRSVTPSAGVVLDGTTGRIVSARPVGRLTATVPADGLLVLPPCTTVRADEVLTAGDVEIGTDLFGWGGFDDDVADGRSGGGTHWVLGRRASIDHSDGWSLRLGAAAEESVRARSIARLPTPRHRWYVTDGDGGRPIGGDPTYSAHLRVRPDGLGGMALRFARYRVMDTDPTSDPTSVRLGDVQVDLPPSEVGVWTSLHLDVTAAINDGSSDWSNATLPSVLVLPGRTGGEVDDLRVYEWRHLPPELTGQWVAADALRAAPGRRLVVTVSSCAG